MVQKDCLKAGAWQSLVVKFEEELGALCSSSVEFGPRVSITNVINSLF